MRKRRYPKRTRHRLLQAAYQQFYRRGFQAAGLNDILADAGVTKGALYHHFPHKRSLGYAVLEECIAPALKKLWLEPLENCSDPLCRLREMLLQSSAKMHNEEITLGCPLNNLALEMSPLDEGFRARINDFYGFWTQSVAGALEAGREAGVVKSTVNVAEAAGFIVGAVAGCRAMAKHARSKAVLEAGFRQLHLYLDTLKA